MNSIPTRFVCATLSIIGAAGLVAFSTPAIAVGGSTARAPVTLVAAASSAAVHNG